MSENILVKIYNELPKIARWLLYALVVIISLFIIINIMQFFYKDYKGKYAKLLWFEANSENKPKDTVFRDLNVRAIAPALSDTRSSSGVIPNTSKKIKKVVVASKGVKMVAETKSTPVQQYNVNGKNENNTNNGTNLGNIGGSNNTVTNNGIIPRIIQPSDPFVQSIVQQVPKNTNIYFVAYGGSDTELNDVKNQFIRILKSYGFTNIESEFHMMIGSTPPANIMGNYDTVRHVVAIHIPFNSISK